MRWKSLAKGLTRRVLLAAAIGLLLYLIQPLVTAAPAVHAVIVVFLFIFAWGYLV